jgi:CheY-like chemotaxis protein
MLVVDDSVSNRKLLIRIFRIKGFTCEEAGDGQDALHKYAQMCAQNTSPEVILMDYEMPVLNGPSSTELLREQGCSCFIIGVTGNVMQADIDFFKSCGADDVFGKPLNGQLVDKLIALISTPRVGVAEGSSRGGATHP